MSKQNQNVPDPFDLSSDSDGLEQTASPTGSISGEVEEPATPKDSSRRRRHELPVLVIEPDSKSTAGPAGRRPQGAGMVSENLEAMVRDLMIKVRRAEAQLREKEEAISNLQEQTVTLARKLYHQGKEPGKAFEDKGPSPVDSNSISLEALDFFNKADSPLKSKSGRTSRRARVRQDPSGFQKAKSSSSCPNCGQDLQKARCLDVQTSICFSCAGIFLDSRAVRQLARFLPWMRYVQKFLHSASQKAKSPHKKK